MISGEQPVDPRKLPRRSAAASDKAATAKEEAAAGCWRRDGVPATVQLSVSRRPLRVIRTPGKGGHRLRKFIDCQNWGIRMKKQCFVTVDRPRHLAVGQT